MERKEKLIEKLEKLLSTNGKKVERIRSISDLRSEIRSKQSEQKPKAPIKKKMPPLQLPPEPAADESVPKLGCMAFPLGIFGMWFSVVLYQLIGGLPLFILVLIIGGSYS